MTGTHDTAQEQQAAGVTISEAALNERLRAWAHVYAGAQYRRTGYAATDALKGGNVPAADDARETMLSVTEIELVVVAMERAGRWRECRILRAEYFMEGLSETERLSRLSRIGLRMGRGTYYTYLRTAHAFLLGALLCRHSGDPETGACP